METFRVQESIASSTEQPLWLTPDQPGHQNRRLEAVLLQAHLGGVELAVVQLQDLQRLLQVGLRLRQLQLDGPQTVGVGGGQVHPQQRQIHLEGRGSADQTRIGPLRTEPALEASSVS